MPKRKSEVPDMSDEMPNHIRTTFFYVHLNCQASQVDQSCTLVDILGLSNQLGTSAGPIRHLGLYGLIRHLNLIDWATSLTLNLYLSAEKGAFTG